MLKTIRENPSLGEYRIYSNNYLYNHFEILLIPGAWEFEQFESFEDSSHIEHDYEPFAGRSEYAKSEGGGYYAGRYGAVEALYKMRRQARVIIFREVSPEYAIPGGVWIVRENVRHALEATPFKTSDFGEAIQELQNRLKQPWRNYAKKSKILNQKRLSDY